jgi:hypothetical protein
MYLVGSIIAGSRVYVLPYRREAIVKRKGYDNNHNALYRVQYLVPLTDPRQTRTYFDKSELQLLEGL